MCLSNAVEVQKCKIGSKFDHVKSMVLIILENIYSERLTSFILVISQQAERKGERSQRRTKGIKGRELNVKTKNMNHEI